MSRYRPKGTTTRSLSDEQVLYYRKAYKEGWMTRRAIMLNAGVSMPTIDRMLNGETYQHLGTQAAENEPGTEVVGSVTREELDDSAKRMLDWAKQNKPEAVREAAEKTAKDTMQGLTSEPPPDSAEDMLNELYGR
jgi:hypothetical protein